jgi:prevent-host-death family protein
MVTKLKERTPSRGSWRLTDAKARFSEVVKLASKEPQRITVDGRDAVVIVSAAVYDREHESLTGAEIVKAFQHPAAADLDFDRVPAVISYREVEL